MRDIEPAGAQSARRILVCGRVQGVGFRPFTYRLARSLGLAGWVRNGAGRVVVHVEGAAADIDRFEAALIRDAPALARPQLAGTHAAAVRGESDFRILASEDAERADVHLPPDLHCCDQCAAELRDPAMSRYRYPFTNCTQCGPRYTIIRALPYDRANTAMAAFALCPRCRQEYENPLDRRFHAEPLACPDCGPEIAFCRGGQADMRGEAALAAAIAELREGWIVAVKGVGGYHLMCDPASDAAVLRLRERKHRPHKPLAVMFPERGADGLEAVRASVSLDEAEARACAAPSRPIVLARRLPECRLSRLLAPGLLDLGVFLPYSPLHHLLLEGFGGPLVATSGNVSGEPVITDASDAASRLGAVADSFLHHDRPIVRPADDSVLRVIGARARAIRAGRGTAPIERDCGEEFARPLLAVGGHMKAAIALGWGRRAVISPHIGELDSPRSRAVFERLVADLQSLYRVEAAAIVCDAHPGYASTRWALAHGLPTLRVQHHAAHASALAGERPEVDRWLTFAWDGVGAGPHGELWGGEALLGSPGRWRRVGSLRAFHVPGADRVAREPWRSAAALMWETGRRWEPPIPAARLVRHAWEQRLRTSRTSSAGRLFDAAAALVLGVESTSFEGQGPMMLEGAAAPTADFVRLPLAADAAGIWRIDWEPLLPVLADRARTEAQRAGLFHESLARALVDQAAKISEAERFAAVGLTGGVFQNRRLAERVIVLLGERGLRALLPAAVPANDGGLAFGQLIEAAHAAGPAPVATGGAESAGAQ